MGILLNITGGHDLGLFEVNEAAEIVQSAADANSNIIFGAVIDDSLGDEVRVTVIATGFDHGGPRPSTARETIKSTVAPLKSKVATVRDEVGPKVTALVALVDKQLGAPQGDLSNLGRQIDVKVKALKDSVRPS